MGGIYPTGISLSLAELTDDEDSTSSNGGEEMLAPISNEVEPNPKGKNRAKKVVEPEPESDPLMVQSDDNAEEDDQEIGEDECVACCSESPAQTLTGRLQIRGREDYGPSF